jgi:murein DD-endopeptidase MepM/ murein hydrolase activator NlpD
MLPKVSPQMLLVNSRLFRGVAQSGSALAWGASGRRFKSSRPDHWEKLVFSLFLYRKTVSNRLNTYPIYWMSLLCFSILSLSACGSRFGKTPPSGEWVTVVSGDSVSKFADKYKVASVDIIEMNGLRDPSRILVGQELFIPQFQRVLVGQSPIKLDQKGSNSQATDLSQKYGFKLLKGAPVQLIRDLKWPIRLSLKAKVGLSSPFGVRKGKSHKGIDISAPTGTEIRAALDGDVIRSEFSKGGYGWVIYIKHTGGVETRYAHHDENLIKAGRYVHAGEVIAKVGNSGRSSGSHLHFEIRVNGTAVDPLIFLPALEGQSSLFRRDQSPTLYHPFYAFGGWLNELSL